MSDRTQKEDLVGAIDERTSMDAETTATMVDAFLDKI